MKVYCSAVIQCSMALLEERIFRGGSTAEIVRSLHKLVDSLPEETEVFPGHDASTDYSVMKRRYNPFM